MGLDTMELVMVMEETFEITIPVADAEKIRTVGGAYRYILAKLDAGGPPTCRGAGVFYRFRVALGTSLSVPRDRVRLETPLEELVPRRGRRAAWRRLEQELGMRLPALRPPAWLVACLVLPAMWSLLFVLVVASAGLPPAVPLGSVVWSLLITLAVAVLVGLPAPSLAVHFPSDGESVRTMVLAIARSHYGRATAREKTWRPDQVWPALRDLIAGQVGIAADEVREEHHFLRDYDC